MTVPDIADGSNDKIASKHMTAQQIVLVQRSWKLLRDVDPHIIGEVFYGKMFNDVPSLRKMFKAPLPAQYKKLTDMLSVMVGRLHNLQEITDEIRLMAERHTGYGVKPWHYQVVGDALLFTMEHGLGNDWNDEVKEAWQSCYALISGIMIEASRFS